MYYARQPSGHGKGIGDCIAALDDQDAVRAYARAASAASARNRVGRTGVQNGSGAATGGP
jgi:hypothetical protein